MTFSWAGDRLFIIDHTEVDEAFGGKGYGGKLVKAGVDYARQRQVKATPLCPFAKREFEKHADYQDVLFG
ncbi:MAG: N-acetyltransferase [Prevotella sp.]|nr:N-acetyltransferase [Prevotella sp.]